MADQQFRSLISGLSGCKNSVPAVVLSEGKEQDEAKKQIREGITSSSNKH